MQEKKYGLQLRVPRSQQKKQPVRPLLPKPAGFNDDDDDDDVEKEISRHAAKNKSLKDIEQQHQKALEEDPSIFDYDGVYDEIKEKIVRPKAQDHQERRPKYIQVLMEKAKQREREHEIVYERKLAKERSKDEHMFADKDRFVTSAYKKKLAEQAKWLEEERLRELREEKDDVTKKSDISDFYFSLSKNVAFGSTEGGYRSQEKLKQQEEEEQKKRGKPVDARKIEKGSSLSKSPESSSHKMEEKKDHQGEVSSSAADVDQKDTQNSHVKHSIAIVEKAKSEEQQAPVRPKPDHHKRSQDALAAYKERFLARKKAKEQL